jgi:hypothetical protein
MSFRHDEIREKFPEYLRGSLSGDMRDAIECHIRDCPACRSELSMMSELVSIDAPDPGNLYWATLPRKVEGLVSGRKENRFSVQSLFIKFVPAAAALAILLVLLISGTGRDGLYKLDSSINNPFTVTYRELSDLTPEDIYILAEKTAGDSLYMESENILEYSYHGEFASLSSGEMNSLNEALKTEQPRGG